MPRRIDHLVLAVNDLDAARDTYGRLGFTLTPVARHPFGTANSLIVLGRAAKDADMLIVAARLLADIDAPVADPGKSTDGNPAYYDVDAIVVEADGYAANRKAGKPASRNYQGFCHYEYLCSSLSCSYVWVC